MTPRMLTQEELSERWGIPVSTLETWRNPKRAPKDPIPFVRLPNGKIRYPEDKLQKWLERNTNLDVGDYKFKNLG